MAVTIRRVTTGDAACLKSARLSALADAPFAFLSTLEDEVGLSDAEWSARTRAASTGTRRALFLAEDGDDVVGLVGGFRDDSSGSGVEVVSMWVASSHRNVGAGRALMAHVAQWAIEGGAGSLGLWVMRGNTPAEALYRKLGFEEAGDFRPLPSDPCKDELRLELVLSDPSE